MKRFLLVLFFITLPFGNAHAGRIAYFEGEGHNEILTNILASAQHATCTIAITISGAATQNYTLTVNAWSVGTAGTLGATDDSTANPADIVPTGSGATTTFTVTRSGITTGTTEVWNFDFLSIGVAPYTGASAIDTQYVHCKGSLEASDTTAGTAGFIIANGNITTIRETTGAKALSGGAIAPSTVGFGQDAVLIGEGRPF